MTKRMLIDATHAEETRVVVLDGNRLEDFDVESSTKKQLKGNIYLAKVVRVEPSLQAAFVEYGGGRHGFLAFGEIHPDYYQIPIADRQRLLAMQAEEARAEAEAEDAEDEQPDIAAPAQASAAQPSAAQPAAAQPARVSQGRRRGRRGERPGTIAVAPRGEAEFGELTYGETQFGDAAIAAATVTDVAAPEPEPEPEATPILLPVDGEITEIPLIVISEIPLIEHADAAGETEATDEPDIVDDEIRADAEDGDDTDDVSDDDQPMPEMIGGEGDTFEGNGAEEARQRRTARFLRNYRIQEVIHRRQIMLIQVVKEERGTKGAALTTYISLAGRFCVLMPNSPRGGGISRKITSAADRRRLKEITSEMEVPQGMGLIVRTAGAARPKPEIKRDCEYLMRLWDDIRETTMGSMAPALIYEEASLIKRSIRDVYSRDVEEILVDGQDGWKAARDFMRMLMPAHAKKVVAWDQQANGGQSLFARHAVDVQLDAMVSPTVQLKSGGYLVINQAEALVAIDVNSGRSTRERGIEETALRTNLEASEEVARQLRLRDLAGLIVIDYIDMESRKHNGMVERRLKDSLKNDRARIQVGTISHFGLMEMSRQRLRPSLAETSFVACPHCRGLGQVRSTESSAVHVLRAIEEEGSKARAGQIMVYVAGGVAMYLLNHKRERLGEIEARYGMFVHFSPDDSLIAPEIRIDRLRPPLSEAERPRRMLASALVADAPDAEDDSIESDDLTFEDDTDSDAPDGQAEPLTSRAQDADATDDADRNPRGKRRRRRSSRSDRAEGEAAPVVTGLPLLTGLEDQPALPMDPDAVPADVADPAQAGQPEVDPEELDENGLPKARRRGRRGGRRRRRDGRPEDEANEAEAEEGVPAYTGPPVTAEAPDAALEPVDAGPTPAEPFVAEPSVAEPFVAEHGADLSDRVDRAEEPAAVPVALDIPPAPDAPVAEAPAVVAPVPEPEPVVAIAPEIPVPEEAPAPPPKRGWWRRGG